MQKRTLPLALVLAGCGSDIKFSTAAICDGALQEQEQTVDDAFDADGDGFFSAANPDCAAVYSPEDLDCDDGDPGINPAAAEAGCDGIDNDCDAATIDAADADADGYSACDDCDDSHPDVHPSQGELACNGLDDDCDALTLDGEDRDGDGFDECSDCDESTIYVSPGLAEILCNGLDDDCDALTPDAADADLDSATACLDCDDEDGLRSPEFEEECGDDIDNDCDEDVDEGCSYSGTWAMDTAVSYTCAFTLVNISFSQLAILDNRPAISIAANDNPPGTTTGTLSGESATTTTTLSGTCDEIYTFSGTFTDPETFAGTFSAEFIGSCFDCADQIWAFTATKVSP